MKSITYKPFITQYRPPSTPEFKPEGYRPQYNWKEPVSSPTSTESTPETTSQEPVQEQSPTETWVNPTGTTLITDLSDPIYQQSSIQRATHIFKDSSIQVGNMQELLDKFADAGISLRITSGYRPGARTSSGNQSWHSQGYALDVTPGTNETWDSLRSKLRNSPELIKYMQDNGYGIIDETTPEMQSRTGATGAHWHIGKDRLAISGLQTLLAKSGIKIPSFRSGRKLEKQRSRVTERLYNLAEQSRQYKQESSQPTIRSEEPLDPISIASILPGTGDIAEGASIINDISNKNFGNALLTAGLLAFPGTVISKTAHRFIPTHHSYLSERLRNGSGRKMGIPEMINGKHIADLMEEVPIYIKPVSTVGAYNASKNEIWIDPHVPKKLYPDIIEHEHLHWLDRNFNKDNQRYKQDYEFLDFENSDANYLTHKIEQIAENDFRDMSEFSPRIVQIKQYKQISDPDYKWKDGELEQAWKEYSTYLKSFDIDNISQHTKTIKDWNKAGNWSDKAVPVLIPLTLPILKQNNGKYQE